MATEDVDTRAQAFNRGYDGWPDYANPYPADTSERLFYRDGFQVRKEQEAEKTMNPDDDGQSYNPWEAPVNLAETVHYRNEHGQCIAAIVVAVEHQEAKMVSLAILEWPGPGLWWKAHVGFDPMGKLPGTWHYLGDDWPEGTPESTE